MADINVTITFKEEHVQTILDAVTKYANQDIFLTVHDGIRPRIGKFVYEEQQPEETPKDFGKRFILEFIRAFVRFYDKEIDQDRYDAEVKTVTLPSDDIPDEIIE